MYTREELISICEAAIVPVEKWSNRDTPQSQTQAGIAWAMLKAGCRFRVTMEDPESNCVTDDGTIWLWIFFPSFGTFDHGGPEDETHIYLPTRKRLAERQGRDWY